MAPSTSIQLKTSHIPKALVNHLQNLFQKKKAKSPLQKKNSEVFTVAHEKQNKKQNGSRSPVNKDTLMVSHPKLLMNKQVPFIKAETNRSKSTNIKQKTIKSKEAKKERTSIKKPTQRNTTKQQLNLLT